MRVTICAARSDEQAELTWNLVMGVLGFAVPAVSVLACLLVRRHVGAALAVVGDLAHEAGQLQNLDQGRLNVPVTGDEVQELAETFNELLDRVHTQAQAVRQFVADAGHELRTPLASLQVCLDLAADADSRQARAAVRDGLIDVERLTGLVDDLLKLARADAGEPPSPTPATIPHALLGEISGLRRRRPDLSVDVEGGPLGICVDITALGTAVGNLLSNAARHATSSVLVRVAEVSERATIEVIDDGPGVAARDLQRIFRRFVRLDDARSRDAGGIGLGLSIAAALIQREGGRVEAFAGPGGRFLLVLPLHRAEQRSQPDGREACPSPLDDVSDVSSDSRAATPPARRATATTCPAPRIDVSPPGATLSAPSPGQHGRNRRRCVRELPTAAGRLVVSGATMRGMDAEEGRGLLAHEDARMAGCAHLWLQLAKIAAAANPCRPARSTSPTKGLWEQESSAAGTGSD